MMLQRTVVAAVKVDSYTDPTSRHEQSITSTGCEHDMTMRLL
jgi:hypothetical protein